MSQYPNPPPPSAYVPPNQQQDQYSYQQPQATPSPYQPTAPNNNIPPNYPHKPSSTAAFGQMFNQAVTTSKPMLNKLGKTISSKLGNKPVAHSTPQHLQNFQSYQEYHQQQNPPQSQPYSPQHQQQQWTQKPPQTQQNAYGTPQQFQSHLQSPYSQSNYATPASGHSSQSNYFPSPQSQPPNAQTPPQQPNGLGYNPTLSQVQNGMAQQQNPARPEQTQDGYSHPGQPQAQPQAGRFVYGTDGGQQTGVVGTSTSPVQESQHAQAHQQPAGGIPQSFHYSNMQQHEQQQQHRHQQQQSQWISPTSPTTSQTPAPQPPHDHTYNAMAPSQQSGTILGPSPHTIQYQQPQQQQNAVQGSPPVSHDQVQPTKHQTSQQGGSVPPITHPDRRGHRVSPPVSPPPPQSIDNKFQAPPASMGATGSAQESVANGFVAELPADMGSLSLSESSKPQSPSYKAYQPASADLQSNSPSQKFTVPRRAVSTSSLPFADPWKVADPTSELPTREFYIIADILFEALDRKFEPHNTGILEASKILQSWRVQGLVDAAAQLFEHDSYSAFGRIWSLKSIPHVLVPCQSSLMPVWNFQQQIHSHEMAVPQTGPSATVRYPNYMPALNRAGWYKSFFQEVISEPETLDKMMLTFCGDTYKPGVFHQPDLQRWDRAQVPDLLARVNTQREAVTRVCQEMAAEMQGKQQ